eukprot:Hpha_TRINITY_DN22923_c0_g1::TRINITY_DN22923_c0_g1_i1::g.154011::m.154011
MAAVLPKLASLGPDQGLPRRVSAASPRKQGKVSIVGMGLPPESPLEPGRAGAGSRQGSLAASGFGRLPERPRKHSNKWGSGPLPSGPAAASAQDEEAKKEARELKMAKDMKIMALMAKHSAAERRMASKVSDLQETLDKEVAERQAERTAYEGEIVRLNQVTQVYIKRLAAEGEAGRDVFSSSPSVGNVGKLKDLEMKRAADQVQIQKLQTQMIMKEKQLKEMGKTNANLMEIVKELDAKLTPDKKAGNMMLGAFRRIKADQAFGKPPQPELPNMVCAGCQTDAIKIKSPVVSPTPSAVTSPVVSPAMPPGKGPRAVRLWKVVRQRMPGVLRMMREAVALRMATLRHSPAGSLLSSGRASPKPALATMGSPVPSSHPSPQ